MSKQNNPQTFSELYMQMRDNEQKELGNRIEFVRIIRHNLTVQPPIVSEEKLIELFRKEENRAMNIIALSTIAVKPLTLVMGI